MSDVFCMKPYKPLSSWEQKIIKYYVIPQASMHGIKTKPDFGLLTMETTPFVTLYYPLYIHVLV